MQIMGRIITTVLLTYCKKGIELKQSTDKYGYKTVAIYKNGKGKLKKVHRLVCEAFLPEYSNSLQVNHIDGNKKNNVYTNLEMCTASENNLHALRTGLRKSPSLPGERNNYSRLTNKQADSIRFERERNPFKRYKDFAEEYNVSITTISLIINNKRYIGHHMQTQ